MDTEKKGIGFFIASNLLKTRNYSFSTIGSLLGTTFIQPIDFIKVRIVTNSEKIALGKKRLSTKPI